MLPYPNWNVVYGEIPAASKWSQLGANDDALSAGTGILDDAIVGRHIATGAAIVPSDLLMFNASKTADQGTGTGGGDITVSWQTKEEYRDTSAFVLASNRFVAPVAGFLKFSCSLNIVGGDGTDDTMTWGLYKNGSGVIRAEDNWRAFSRGGVEQLTTITGGLKLAAGDFVDIRFNGVQSLALTIMGGAAGNTRSHFSGIFVPSF